MPRVTLKGSVQYGSRRLVDINLDFTFTDKLILAGTHGTGKSLVLKCLYSKAVEKFGRPWEPPSSLNCEVEGLGEYVAVYVDSYRMITQLYWSILRPEFLQMYNVTKELSVLDNDIAEQVREEVKNGTKAVVSMLKADINALKELKKGASNELWTEALSIIRSVEKHGAKAGLIDDVVPPIIDVLEKSVVWYDKYLGAEGDDVTAVPGFAPALVLQYAMLAYANSYRMPVVLIIEEPEAFASPVTAFALGYLLRRLAGNEPGKFMFAVSTHSLDFLYGAGPPAYILTREGGKIRVWRKWEGEGVVPLFTDTTVYKYLLEKL